jgi:hypothetical protein
MTPHRGGGTGVRDGGGREGGRNGRIKVGRD